MNEGPYNSEDFAQPDANEMEQLVRAVSSPESAMEMLLVGTENWEKLHDTQKEYLMEQIEADPEMAYCFYIDLRESGVMDDPRPSEQWCFDRLKRVVEKNGFEE